MSEILAYLDTIKLRLVTSRVVAEYQIVKERTTATDGYLRVRATLANGDFVEMAECFERGASGMETVEYRHQWMDPTKTQLQRRWDNTPHHPELSNFPHHVHLESKEQVVAGQPMSICRVLDVLEDLVCGERE